MKGIKAEKGFTLTELMVALGVTMVVVAAALALVVTSNRATIINEQTADIQQNVRLAMDLLANEIKLAGFNMPGSNSLTTPVIVGACSIGTPARAMPLVPQDQTPGGAVGAVNDQGPDSIMLVVPNLTAGSTGGPAVLANTVTGANILPMSAADVTAMTTAGMAVGSVVSIGGNFSSTVQAVGATQIALADTPQPSVRFPAGTPVYLLQCVQYALSFNPVTCAGSNSCLLRNGVPLVDGVEDLQLAYGCDGCNTAAPNPLLPNGIIDEQDGSGNFSQGDFISNNAWTVTPNTPDSIRLVQVTVVVRQGQADQGISDAGGSGTLAKNSPAPVVASDHNPINDPAYNALTYAQQRRRVLTRTIQVRNFGT